MARCANGACGCWRPDLFIQYTHAGMCVDGRWFCSASCVETIAQRRLLGVQPPRTGITTIPALRLGTLLIHQGTIDSNALRYALEQQQRTGLRLGAQLLRMGLADSASILRALAAQAGVSYLTAVDPSCVTSAPGGLSRDEVRALGVAPFRADQVSRLLLVACTAPLPRAALAALRQLTRWNPEPYLVTDADADVLVQAYGTGTAGTRPAAEFTRVRGVQDAAARIAAAAATGRDVTVTETRWDPYTWVRVETPALVQTLVMPSAADDVPPTKEQECREATTSH